MGNSNSNQHQNEQLPSTGISPNRDPVMSEFLSLPRVNTQQLHHIYNSAQLDELNRELGEEVKKYWENKCQCTNDADAHSCLAAFYHLGLSGISKSPQKAYQHYTIAAQANHPVAQYMICGLYTCNPDERNSYARLLGKEEYANTVVENFVKSAAQSSHYTFAHNDLWESYEDDAPHWKCAVKNLIRSHRAIIDKPGNTPANILGRIYNELGYLIAMVNLIDQDDNQEKYQLAMNYFIKAAEQYGNPAGYLNLANIIYANGFGADKDTNKVLEYRQKAADANHSRGLFLIALQNDTTSVANKDIGLKFVENIDKSLSFSFTKNLLIAALNCSSGNGGKPPDMQKASQYLKLALFAQEYNDQGFSGSAAAYELLGYLYLHGQGVEQNIPMASTCYATGASLGFLSSNLHLAKMIEKKKAPNATLKDAIAVYLYYTFNQEADPIHVAHCRYRLGKIFNNSNDPEQHDSVRAAKYFHSAAKIYKEVIKSKTCLGKAFYHLGVMYHHGFGVKASIKQANSYYKSVIKRNSEQYRLYDVHYAQKAKRKLEQLPNV
ncbi:hypothetical protein TrispH2_009838 [Trichoplax sp. H2]|nr:hypothetical protein TrispH2_009838 [Trichoplax sp. H2]|eukprot:RDD38196.1 hypothetical protein TrispH2_009838 [Trichoplax sp. H2]